MTEMSSNGTYVSRRAALTAAGGALLVATSPPSPAVADDGGQRRRSVRTADALYGALQAKDLEAFAALWAADAVSTMPVNPPGEIHGRDEIVQGIGFFFMATGVVGIDWQVRPMLDPHAVVATWTMQAELLAGGVYRNRGVNILRVRGDEIVRSDEYLDTVAFLDAFGGS
jgi:ketosteroid isomerase-like protein